MCLHGEDHTMKTMKKTAGILGIMILLLAACESQNKENIVPETESETVSSSSEQTESEKLSSPPEQEELERGFLVEGDKEIGPIVGRKINTSKKGVEVPLYQFFGSQMSKGDDGSCYYFRKTGEGKEEKIVFYKDQGVKVCETTIPEALQEAGYVISSFAKYQDWFVIQLAQYDEGNLIICLRIEDGRWGGILDDGWEGSGYEQLFVYDDCLYLLDDHSKMTIINVTRGTKRVLELDVYETTLEMIVDDKIYYSVWQSKKKPSQLMWCNLDGSEKELLFQCPDSYINHVPESIRIDGDDIYVWEPDCECTLTRVPLYGGKIQEIVEADWYDMSDDNIFYMDKNQSVYKVDKELKNAPVEVTTIDMNRYMGIMDGATPFLCADGHLMVERYNKENCKMIRKIWGDEGKYGPTDDDIEMNYAHEYHWITENGHRAAAIEGGDFRKEYRERYDLAEWMDEE